MKILFFALTVVLTIQFAYAKKTKQIDEPTLVDPEKEPKKEFYQLYVNGFQELPGTELGYCFPWSLAVLDRQRGDSHGKIQKKEWKRIEKESRVDPSNGGTKGQDIFRYFYERGYSLEAELLEIGKCDEYYYAANKMEQGCQIMLWMYPLSPISQVSGHVEAVLGFDNCSAITNSWGSKGRVTTRKKFLHNNMLEYSFEPSEGYLLIACKAHDIKKQNKETLEHLRLMEVK